MRSEGLASSLLCEAAAKPNGDVEGRSEKSAEVVVAGVFSMPERDGIEIVHVVHRARDIVADDFEQQGLA